MINQHTAYGLAAENRGSLEEARWQYQQAADQGDPGGLFGLALLTLKAGNSITAQELFTRHHNRFGPSAEVFKGLAFAALEQGKTYNGVGMMLAAGAHSEALFYELHRPESAISGEEHYRRHCAWAATQMRGEPLRLDWDGRRPLRVGYVGVGLIHTVNNFLDPIIANHDPVKVGPMIFGAAVDLQTCLDAKLDIAVDLLGHMAGGPTQHLFASRIAPIQCSYIGYPHATGFDDVVRITDEVTDPIESGKERVIRLPGCAYAYRPSHLFPPVFRDPHKGIVFGSFNRPCKITPETAEAWGDIIRTDTGYRLKVLAHGGEKNLAMREMLEAAGIPGERLELFSKSEPSNYMRRFNEMDVVLDIIGGYSGMTTVCDARWMGLPVVTYVGQTSRGRIAASLVEYAADDREGYVAMAMKWADQGQPSTADRQRQRTHMQCSRLMNGRRVAASLEAAYISLAHESC
jgi:hypothetical protein